MKLEVGEFYLTVDKKIVTIDSSFWYNNPSNIFYEVDGKTDFDINKIVAHIPEQLLNHLLVEVNNYHTDNEFKQIIDNKYGETK